MYKIVLLRHGESIWNQDNRFMGWTDVDLSKKGLAEAHAAGQLLKVKGYAFDTAFVSVLNRAVKTLWTVLEETNRMWIPVYHSWRLNERHYGALQGLNKAKAAIKFGDAQVLAWRRGYDTQPPALEINDVRYQANDPRYADLAIGEYPRAESLKDTLERLLPYWQDTIAPAVKGNKNVIITTHGNSLRALIKHLDNVSDKDIFGLNIPTAQPLIYELDADLNPIRHYFLGDSNVIDIAMEPVANKGKFSHDFTRSFSVIGDLHDPTH
jgi:2,3-bisphosphoglycerate-dependent phosphoglycerate mutase